MRLASVVEPYLSEGLGMLRQSPALPFIEDEDESIIQSLLACGDVIENYQVDSKPRHSG
jgi:hypothetical protein